MKKDNVSDHNQRLKSQLAQRPDLQAYQGEADPERARAMDVAKKRLLAVLVVLVALVFGNALYPWPHFQAPPETLAITDLQETQVKKRGAPRGVFLEGKLKNETGKPIKKAIFQVRYSTQGRSETEYLVFKDIKEGEVRDFSQRLQFTSEPTQSRQVIPLDMQETL